MAREVVAPTGSSGGWIFWVLHLRVAGLWIEERGWLVIPFLLPLLCHVRPRISRSVQDSALRDVSAQWLDFLGKPDQTVIRPKLGLLIEM